MGDYISLALDMGATFGWALCNNGVIFKSGEVTLSRHADEHPGHRWIRWQEWLYNHRHVNEILYEDVTGFRGSDAAKVNGAQLSFLHVFCLQHKIRYCSISAQQVKIDFTGRGNANKEQMCEVAHNLGWRHGKRGTDLFNNEADACALAWVIYTRRQIQPSFAAPDSVMIDNAITIGVQN